MLPSGDVGSSDPALIYRQLFPLVVAPGDPVELNDTEAVVVLEGELIWVGKVYSLFPHVTGPPRRYILSSLTRLVPPAGKLGRPRPGFERGDAARRGGEGGARSGGAGGQSGDRAEAGCQRAEGGGGARENGGRGGGRVGGE
eukprot:294607-Prorocentrum_minimum.AAC.1